METPTDPSVAIPALCTSLGRSLGADAVLVTRSDRSTIVDHALVGFGTSWPGASVVDAGTQLSAQTADPTATVVVADTASSTNDEARAAAQVGWGAYIRVPIGTTPGERDRVLWVAWQRRNPAISCMEARLVELVADAIAAGDSSMPATTLDETRSRVSSALRGGVLRTVFQPIVALDSGRAIGVEALSRFRDGKRPDLWFADADAVGLGIALELAAIRSALSGFSSLPGELYMSINASPAALASAELHQLLDAAPGNRVVVEVTEHAQVEDYSQLHAAMSALRERGVRLAVDDVGSGFSSFAHVLALRPDIVKVDVSITRGIDTDPARRALARGVVSVARDLGATVVVEGIETLGELNTALDVGIDAGQGYLLARPGDLPIPSDYPRPTNRVLDDRGRPVADDDLLAYVTRSWIRANDLESVARSFLQIVQARTGLQTSYLTIVDADTGALDHRYVHNAGPIDLPEGIVIPWEDTLCKRARDAGIRWTPDVPHDLPGCAAAEAFGVTTFLSVPVTRPDGTTAGTLCAASTETRNVGNAVIDEIELMAKLLADRIDHGA